MDENGRVQVCVRQQCSTLKQLSSSKHSVTHKPYYVFCLHSKLQLSAVVVNYCKCFCCLYQCDCTEKNLVS
jgi:hypothetical protein